MIMNLDDILYHHASFTSIASRSQSSRKKKKLDAKNVDVKSYIKLCAGTKFFTTISLDLEKEPNQICICIWECWMGRYVLGIYCQNPDTDLCFEPPHRLLDLKL